MPNEVPSQRKLLTMPAVHCWFYSIKLSPQYWQLLHCLEEMEDRWNSNRATECKPSLAGQFANELQSLHDMYQSDPNFTIRVVSPVGGLHKRSGMSYSNTMPPSHNMWLDGRDSGDPAMGSPFPSSTTQRTDNCTIRNMGDGDVADWRSPSGTSDSRNSARSSAADDLAAVVASLSGDRFLEMDRVISLADFNLATIDLGDFTNISEQENVQPTWPPVID